jgi:hypothetical protein
MGAIEANIMGNLTIFLIILERSGFIKLSNNEESNSLAKRITRINV